MSTIKIRRGEEASIPTLSLGELAFTTDTKKFFVGNGVGNVLMAMSSDIDIIKSVEEDYNANSSEILLVNSLIDQIDITLPASPENGDKIVVFDTGYNSETNNIVLLRNGNMIGNYDEDLTIDVNGASALLMFDGVRLNWFVQL